MNWKADPEDEENQLVYRDLSVTRHYAEMNSIFPAEEVILTKIAKICRGRPILDLGVGAGRTSPYLRALSDDYLGIDYSPEMIDECRTRFPNVRFEVGDARHLDWLKENSFALIMFSFNGIDYVEHSDRLQILKEVRRLLVDDGVFVFSTHNAHYDRRREQPSVYRELGNAKDWLVSVVKWLKLRRRPIRNPHYSYRAETTFDKRGILVTYYISAESQIAQLLDHGFICDELIDRDGNAVVAGADKEAVNPWIYYIACKNPLPSIKLESAPTG